MQQRQSWDKKQTQRQGDREVGEERERHWGRKENNIQRKTEKETEKWGAGGERQKKAKRKSGRKRKREREEKETDG